MEPKLGGLSEVILYVRDMQGAVSFYRDVLGLSVSYPIQKDYAGAYWVEFSTGACTLALHAGADETAPSQTSIVFATSDIAGTRAVLVSRGVSMDEIHSPAPGIQVSNGRSPEGHPFSLEQRGE